MTAGRCLGLVLALMLPGVAAAQDSLTISPPARDGAQPGAVTEGTAEGTAEEAPGGEAPDRATGAVVAGRAGLLRVLDKLDGSTADIELAPGEEGQIGSLMIVMGECRYPADNPSGDAYALVSIRTIADDTALFEGWMIASAPALNAMDHPRYDVWVLRCVP